MSVCKSTYILIPIGLEKHQTGYLEGFYKEFDKSIVYYITNNRILKNIPKEVIGYVGNANWNFLSDNRVFIDKKTNELSINNYSNDFIEIYYNHKELSESEILSAKKDDYGEIIENLVENLKQKNARNSNKSSSKLLKLIAPLEILGRFSMTCYHFHDVMQGFDGQKYNTKLEYTNYICAKFFDIILGLIFLYFFINYELYFLETMDLAREETIENLKSLLTYLMGSPIGLKLNGAFNRGLGTFFFYHISLWKLFLRALQPYLMMYLRLFVVPAGIFGLSFGITLLSDLISVTTFHVYCIYVYATRLFYFQLKGLISLWRLFIGRKHNPLRERVDSFQYSQHQLFIGTLGFTVLLFLFPTTIMYYTVFTTFRMVILFINQILDYLRHLSSRLPIYLTILYMKKSSKLSGKIQMKWLEDNRVEIQMERIEIGHLCKDLKRHHRNRSVGRICYQALTGTLI